MIGVSHWGTLPWRSLVLIPPPFSFQYRQNGVSVRRTLNTPRFFSPSGRMISELYPRISTTPSPSTPRISSGTPAVVLLAITELRFLHEDSRRTSSPFPQTPSYSLKAPIRGRKPCIIMIPRRSILSPNTTSTLNFPRTPRIPPLQSSRIPCPPIAFVKRVPLPL